MDAHVQEPEVTEVPEVLEEGRAETAEVSACCRAGGASSRT